VTPDELDAWFEANRNLLETAYLQGREPWQQSGFGLHTPHTPAEWEAERRPIADCMDAPGAFLDIGCANGYLLETVLGWTSARGIAIDPYGLDLSAALVALARQRLPRHAEHLFVGNGWTWDPPRRFDYVRTELVYVPEEFFGPYVARLQERFLTPGGRLLIAEYRSKGTTVRELTVDRTLADLGFTVRSIALGYRNGVEYTRVAVV
jgi:SAM-dependent methyltransferase